MRFDGDARGEWIVDPDELARKLGVTTQQRKDEMMLGPVHTRIEMRRGADRGRRRVRVQCRESIWQDVFDCNGCLIHEYRLSPDRLPVDTIHEDVLKEAPHACGSQPHQPRSDCARRLPSGRRR
ncbi:DUF6522 family protein [Methylobacterium nigriterrae]|uniref:DUF6522 family protein n=1 Tax=Methylobacterium nigriterrae TaxID=3127512 RepID=UPI003D6733EC